jgi:RNA polymerase sigma-70 factor, ECF subfamily
VRDEGRRVLATLVRLCGSWQLAEDALQDATERALVAWRRDGVPPEPRAWLTLAARRRAVDIVRREAARDAKEAGAVPAYTSSGADDPITGLERLVSGEWPEAAEDDQLSLVFACCHPSLAPEAQLALALRFLCGLSTPEVARALLVPEATMSKRLTRAKDKMARAGVPFRVPPVAALPDRVSVVAGVVALLFNEGYASVGGDPVGGGGLQRPDLTAEAIRLGRLLRSLMPDDATVAGLLALMLLQDSRRAARVDAAGDPVLLRDQDRQAWDREQVSEGVRLVAEGLRRTRETPDRFVVQAALAACHAIAPTWEETDWDAVVSWYDVLLTVEDTPVVRLNRAVAVSERDGAAAGLAELDRLEEQSGWDGHVWFHASRAELLARVGRRSEADRAFGDALVLPLADGWRRRLERRRAEVAGGRG